MGEAHTAELDADSARAAAFSRLVGGQLDQAYRLAAVILGSRYEGEEAVHDAALRAWQRWHTLRDPARFDAWFGRILVNVCRDRLRRRRWVEPSLSAEPSSTGQDPFVRTAEVDALREAIQRLTPEHRAIVGMRYLADLSLEQMAERLGRPLGTVKSRLHHAVAELRAAYAAVERAGEERRS